MRAVANKILVEVAGPGVSPGTVAARELLELASSYLETIVQIAKDEEDRPLTFKGLRVVAKCAAIEVDLDDADLAVEAGERVTAYLASPTTAPRGVRSAVARLERALRDLPPTYEPGVRIRQGEREHRFRLQIVREPVDLPPREVVHLRAKPIRAGGSRAVVRFEARGEGKPFTLVASSWDMVRKAGGALKKPCDIAARVNRDSEGDIIDGKLLEIEIPEADSKGAWERWYEANRGNVSVDLPGDGETE